MQVSCATRILETKAENSHFIFLTENESQQSPTWLNNKKVEQ